MKNLDILRLPARLREYALRYLSRRKFERFERSFHAQTLARHGVLLEWARKCAEDMYESDDPRRYESSSDPVVRQGYALRQQVMQRFSGKYRHLDQLRILVHLPSPHFSPGGFSLFSNLIQSLNFLGVPVQALGWNHGIAGYLERFKPTVLITSDSQAYLDDIDWRAVAGYRRGNPLRVGLTASIAEYGNTPVQERLGWARAHDVDFFYSFRTQGYLLARKEYQPFFANGYPVYSIEFGANPLFYYPVPGVERDIDFVFLASSNAAKRDRYFAFLASIVVHHPGFIDGPGWAFSKQFDFSQNRDRFLYARAKVGINLHIDNQIEWASELNERTYMLAACGVPQLLDNPKLLPMRFSEGCFYVAATPREYESLFEEILIDHVRAQGKALLAQKEVFEKHTTFHRAEDFVRALIQ